MFHVCSKMPEAVQWLLENPAAVGVLINPWDRIKSPMTNQIPESTRSETPVVVTLRRWVVPNIGRQLILERRIHGVAEQF